MVIPAIPPKIDVKTWKAHQRYQSMGCKMPGLPGQKICAMLCWEENDNILVISPAMMDWLQPFENVEVIRKHSIHVNHNLSADMVQSWIDEKQRRCIISSFFSVLCPTFPPSLVNKNPFFQSSQPTIKRLQHWKNYMFNKKNGKPFLVNNLECRPWNHQNPNIESVMCFLLIS